MKITIKEFDISGTILWYLQPDKRAASAKWGTTKPTIANVKQFLQNLSIDTNIECWSATVTPEQVVTKPTPSILKNGDVVVTATVQRYSLGWHPKTLPRKDGGPIPESPGDVYQYKDRSKILEIPTNSIEVEW